jgi:alpha-L-rhamnosidase
MQLIVICSSAQLSVQKLLTENNHNPIGLDVTIPRFSWQLLSSKRNVFQTAYQIQVFIAGMDNAVVWNSGKVMSEQSVLVPYSGAVN